MGPEVAEWMTSPATVDARRMSIVSTTEDVYTANDFYQLAFRTGSLMSDLSKAARIEDLDLARRMQTEALKEFAFWVAGTFEGQTKMIDRVLAFATWAGTPILDVREDDKHDA